MGQLIGVIATIYNFVRLPRAGVRSNDGEFASADLHPWHSKAGPRSLLRSERKLSAIGRDEICRQHGLSSMQAAAAIAMTAG
ncbi:MAG: hypothetical protein WA723_08320 [Pseudolabrys sp.]